MSFANTPGVVLLRLDEKIASALAFGLQKDSEFREAFNYHLLRLKESGIIDVLAKRTLYAPNEEFEVVIPPSLSYLHVAFPFVCLAWLTLISFALAVSERITAMALTNRLEPHCSAYYTRKYNESSSC